MFSGACCFQVETYQGLSTYCRQSWVFSVVGATSCFACSSFLPPLFWPTYL